jgi:uncharacterized protein YbjT (DUF2867 family)
MLIRLGKDKGILMASLTNKTKWEGEQVVRNIFPDATIIRPATLWGAQDTFLNSQASMMKFWPLFPLVHPQKLWQPAYVCFSFSQINSPGR